MRCLNAAMLRKAERPMKKIIDIFNKIEEWILVILMTILALVVFLQVVFRIFASSLPWSEELSRFITIWISFLGASYGFRYGAHIGVEAFKAWLPFRIRRIIDLLANIAVIIIAVLMMYYGYSIIVDVHLKFGQVSPAMRMPMWIAYLAIPVGYFFMVLRNIGLSVDAVKDILRGEVKEEDENIDIGGIML